MTASTSSRARSGRDPTGSPVSDPQREAGIARRRYAPLDWPRRTRSRWRRSPSSSPSRSSSSSSRSSAPLRGLASRCRTRRLIGVLGIRRGGLRGVGPRRRRSRGGTVLLEYAEPVGNGGGAFSAEGFDPARGADGSRLPRLVGPKPLAAPLGGRCGLRRSAWMARHWAMIRAPALRTAAISAGRLWMFLSRVTMSHP